MGLQDEVVKMVLCVKGWKEVGGFKYSSLISQNVPDALPKRRRVEHIRPKTMGQELPEILLCSRTYQPPQQTITEDDIVLEGWLWRMISLSQKVSQQTINIRAPSSYTKHPLRIYQMEKLYCMRSNYNGAAGAD